MIRTFTLLVFLSIACFSAFCLSEKWEPIPDSLKKNAWSVIRSSSEKWNVNSLSHIELEVAYDLTILCPKGEKDATFYIPYDRNSKVKSIKVVLLDKEGKLIRKIKSKDIGDYSYYDGSLYSDNRYKLTKIQNITYPYTVSVSYKKVYNGTPSFENFKPLNQFNQSVQQAAFSIALADTNILKYKELNFQEKGKKTFENGKFVFRWEVKNLKALEREPFSTYLYEKAPEVLTQCRQFIYDGVPGRVSDWASVSSFVSGLEAGRDELPEKTVETIKLLVAETTDTLKKIEKIYQYMQNRTRYVSIQIGIGGWQTFPAATVDKLGYGDCKALSNYTKALLKCVGIKSSNAIVRAGHNKSTHCDFASFNQFNHQILMVPLANDTVWLECTSQTSPYNYLGSFTSNRKALEIKPVGGNLVRTQNLDTLSNQSFASHRLSLGNSGNISCVSRFVESGWYFDDPSFVVNLSPKEQKDWFVDFMGLNIEKLNHLNIRRVPESNLPKMEIDAGYVVHGQVSVSGVRMFIPLDFRRKISPVKSDSSHFSPFEIDWSKINIDTLYFKIPEGYKLEYLPQAVCFKSEFGSYQTWLNKSDTSFSFIRKIVFFEGKHPAAKYNLLAGFLNKTIKAEQAKVILIRKEQ